MYLSVVCAEDVSRITDDESVGHGKGTVFGAALVDRAKTWCGQWKAATMPEAYFAPVRTEHPTLVLSGERDPATPPRWGELVAERLPNARHIVLAGAGHGVTALGCVPEIIDEFLTSGEPLAVDASCAQRVTAPPLFTRPTGY
jgi:pimeloyl-ACP methyl ester carboxylesterase